MAGSLSSYVQRGLLNHFFGVASFAQPSNIYIGLSTADPLADGSGLAEPVGGSYARVQCNTWQAAATSSGAARSYNPGAITFPAATGSWGTLTHFLGADALVGGNLLFSGSLDAPQVVTSGVVAFDAGDLDASLSGSLSDAVNEDLLDHLLKVASMAPPAAIWAAISTADPGANGGSLAEVTGGTYARKQITGWNHAVSGVASSLIENAFSHDFAPAAGGTAKWLALFSAASGGTYYGRAQLNRPRSAALALRLSSRGLDYTAA